ncbi:MAG: hypothetical protein ACRENG_18415, partial [bacterium]
MLDNKYVMFASKASSHKHSAKKKEKKKRDPVVRLSVEFPLLLSAGSQLLHSLTATQLPSWQ